MSRREGSRSQVSVELGSGKIVNGIVSSWSASDISVSTQQSVPQTFAPAEIKRVSIQIKANRWKKGITAVLLGYVGFVVAALASAESGKDFGVFVGLGAGAAI